METVPEVEDPDPFGGLHIGRNQNANKVPRAVGRVRPPADTQYDLGLNVLPDISRT